MAYDEGLADRIRDCLTGVDGVSERKMFGGLAFMVFGNMACGPNGDRMIVRVGPDAYEKCLALPGASEMTFTGRPMRGFIELAADSLDDTTLAAWVDRGVAFASSLPAK
ncbi:MAG: TfoX/Sxy family protein [Solirubrobacterales bacterium]